MRFGFRLRPHGEGSAKVSGPDIEEPDQPPADDLEDRWFSGDHSGEGDSEEIVVAGAPVALIALALGQQ